MPNHRFNPLPFCGRQKKFFISLLKISFYLLLLISFEESFARGGSKGHPFRKFDNTPNPINEDIWTVTLESNTYQDTGYLSPIIDFSSKKGWDIQLASYNIPMYGGGADNYEWDTYVNLSQTFVITPSISALIGSQNGTTLLSQQRQLHHVDYGLLIYQPLDAINLHGGPYWANKSLTTTTNVVGYTAGFGIDILPNKLAIQGDYFSGQNNLSGGIFNVLYRVIPYLQFYMGVGIPASNSGNEFFGIAGFNLFTLRSKEDVEPSTVVQ